MRQMTILLGLLMMLAAANVWAQAKPVCSLLTANDLSAAGAAGQGVEGSMPFPDGTPKGGVMNLCNWRMPTGGLMLSASKMPPGVSREAIMATLNQSWSELKTKGWTEEKKAFGGVSCFLMTPPAGDKGSPNPTSCTVFTKGMVLSITTMATTRVPMEKVKALVDSAAGRL
jgi:hypothetical protein